MGGRGSRGGGNKRKEKETYIRIAQIDGGASTSVTVERQMKNPSRYRNDARREIERGPRIGSGIDSDGRIRTGHRDARTFRRTTNTRHSRLPCHDELSPLGRSLPLPDDGPLYRPRLESHCRRVHDPRAAETTSGDPEKRRIERAKRKRTVLSMEGRSPVARYTALSGDESSPTALRRTQLQASRAQKRFFFYFNIYFLLKKKNLFSIFIFYFICYYYSRQRSQSGEPLVPRRESRLSASSECGRALPALLDRSAGVQLCVAL